MIEVVLTNGDSAEADSPEAALVAARTILGEALENVSTIGPKITAAFYTDGFLVRQGVHLYELRSEA